MRIGEIKATATRAHLDAAVREGLFAAMLTGQGKDAYNAAWVLTHLPSADNGYISEYRDKLAGLATSTADASLRRLSLVLLARIDWAIGDVRADLLDFCLQHLASPAEPYGVRSLCMKVAYKQCRHYPALASELRQHLMLIRPEELGAGARHTRNMLLSLL